MMGISSHGEDGCFPYAGNEESMFEINNVTGVLRTVASLDREETDMYILTIQAVDSAVNPLSSITEVRVGMYHTAV